MEDMNKYMMHLMEKASGEEDYMDEEGYLCCGKCHTRKECRATADFLRRYDKNGNPKRPTTCRCRTEEIEREREEEENRRHRETVRRLKQVCFTASAMKDYRFENATLVSEDVLEKAKQYVLNWDVVKKENSGLLFWGDVGTGKSYTAACIANALMEQEVPVLMRNMGDFMSAAYGDIDELCREIARYSLVIIDDLGMERRTEYGLEVVFRIINTRCESRKPTIITTNLTLDEMKNAKDREHRRIYDRVFEMCMPVFFSGKSVRNEIHQSKLSVFKKIFKGGK